MSRACYGYKSASDVFYLQNGFYRFNGKLKQCPYESISACNANTRLMLASRTTNKTDDSWNRVIHALLLLYTNLEFIRKILQLFL